MKEEDIKESVSDIAKRANAARNKKLSQRRRIQIARIAAQARWAKHKKKKKKQKI